MTKISAVIITYNEEEKISSALKSLEGVADEIVVVDSFSSDQTPALCTEMGARFIQHEWEGYVRQKQFAVDQASFDWVLSLDADEKLSEELRTELMQWKQQREEGINGYYLHRLTLFMGRWIRHTSWYPDRQMRLFRRTKGKWVGGRVHERFEVEGAVGRFPGHLLHLTYASISEYLRQLENFSVLAARDALERGKPVGGARLILHPPVVFLRNYVVKRGFLDGLPGFVVSVLAAASTFFKYLQAQELQREQRERTRW